MKPEVVPKPAPMTGILNLIHSSRRPIVAGLFCAVLSACAMPQKATDRVSVLDGEMTLAAPMGYCVDPSARHRSSQGDFVLFGSCAAISGDASAPHPAYRAMLSATVGPKAAAPLVRSFPAFESFFHSSAGRAAIARSGLAQDVDILSVKQQDDMMLLKIRDRSASREAPVSPVYWRAITDLDGRIGALSVLPLQGAAMSDNQQIALLRSFDASIREASKGR